MMTNVISSHSALSFAKWDCSPAGVRPGSYSPLMVRDMIREAAVLQSDGTLLLRFYEPGDEGGIAVVNKEPITLHREGEYLAACIPAKPGILQIDLIIDGHPFLYPYLPITVFSNRQTNFLEIIEKGSLFDESSGEKGSISMHCLFNSVKQTEDRVFVYVPRAYYEDPSAEFDTLFLQHGFGENELGWLNVEKVNVVMDNMIARGEVKPMILVMCNGMFQDRTEETITIEPFRFSEFLVRDVIPFIRNTYRVSGKMHLAGLSMGSIQASITALENPGMFESIGLFSGFLHDPMTQYAGHLTPERIRAFKASGCRMFRCIGTSDRFLPVYRMDDDFIENNGIVCTSVTYEGAHEPNVWRSAIIDYLRFIREGEV